MPTVDNSSGHSSHRFSQGQVRLGSDFVNFAYWRSDNPQILMRLPCLDDDVDFQDFLILQANFGNDQFDDAAPLMQNGDKSVSVAAAEGSTEPTAGEADIAAVDSTIGDFNANWLLHNVIDELTDSTLGRNRSRANLRGTSVTASG